MYTYKTIVVHSQVGTSTINALYRLGWEFVNATAEIVSTGGTSHLIGGVYFTVRIKTPPKGIEIDQ